MAQPPTPDPDELKFRRSILQDEIKYRRDRRSGIFTWASSILMAVTGGVIAIQLNSGRVLEGSQKIILSGAVLVLALYAGLWWDKQRRRGQVLRKEQVKIDLGLQLFVPEYEGSLLNKVGGLVAIILLALTALAAIWIPVSGAS